jgi:hypothetical protein
VRLLTKTLLRRFAKVGEQDVPNPIIVAKFFNPCGAGTWYATCYIPDERLFFGWAEIVLDGGEWGYFSLDELQAYKGPFGIGIERDLYWKEKQASEVIP